LEKSRKKDKNKQNIIMAFNQVTHKPDIFSDKEHEDKKKLIKQFEILSFVNEWEDKDKLIIGRRFL